MYILSQNYIKGSESINILSKVYNEITQWIRAIKIALLYPGMYAADFVLHVLCRLKYCRYGVKLYPINQAINHCDGILLSNCQDFFFAIVSFGINGLNR